MESSAERLLALISASRPETGEEGDIPGAALAEYSVEARRKQKMLCSQLQVLHFLLEFLEQEDPASWEVDPEMLSQEVDEVKQQWKALKTEYQEKVKDITDLLPDLLQKQQLLQERKQRLERVLHQYQLQREAADSMMQMQGEQERQIFRDLLQDKGESLERCRVHIHQLEGEVRRLDNCAGSWIQASLWSSVFSGLLQALQGVSFMSVAQMVLVLDMNVDLVLETPEPMLDVPGEAAPDGEGGAMPMGGSEQTLHQVLLHGSTSHLMTWHQRCSSRTVDETLWALGVLQQSPRRRIPR